MKPESSRLSQLRKQAVQRRSGTRRQALMGAGYILASHSLSATSDELNLQGWMPNQQWQPRHPRRCSSIAVGRQKASPAETACLDASSMQCSADNVAWSLRLTSDVPQTGKELPSC